MDLALYGKVLWRFRAVIAIGFVAAVLLAFLAIARVSFAGGTPEVSYRKAEIWQSQAQLLLTQSGFPYGSSTEAANSAFTGLVGLYATFVNSDAVQRQLDLSLGEAVRGQTVVDSSAYGSNSPLPVLGINGFAPNATEAERIANRATVVFQNYINQRQQSAAIPKGQRIVLQELNSASPAIVVQGRKKTLAILAFVTVMIAAFGLAFLLENLRPQAKTVASPADREPELLQKSA